MLNHSKDVINNLKVILRLKIIKLSKIDKNIMSEKSCDKNSFLQNAFDDVISRWKSCRNSYISRNCEIKKYQEIYVSALIRSLVLNVGNE